jgi:hypothetical protein
MRLPRLPLQTMLLLSIMRMIMLRPPTMADMRLNIRVILLDRVRILRIENLHTEFDIRQ